MCSFVPQRWLLMSELLVKTNKKLSSYFLWPRTHMNPSEKLLNTKTFYILTTALNHFVDTPASSLKTPPCLRTTTLCPCETYYL